MPLTELSLGHIAHNRSGPSQPERNAQTDQFPQNGKPSFSPSPSSIQNMLRNTTETGDIGQLHARTVHRSPSAFQADARARQPASSRLDRHGGMSKDMHEHADTRARGRSEAAHDASDADKSSLSSQNGMRRQHPMAGPSLEEYRSWSMTQSSYVSHSLASRDPYAYQSHHSRGTGPRGRPRSPFAYPTRLKRPGYRPSSPALSDLHHPSYGSAHSSRPSSPASMHSMSRLPHPWQQHPNRSDPNLRHYPPFHAGGIPYNSVYSPPSVHSTTSRPPHTLRGVSSSSRLPRAQLSIASMWTHQESSSSSPLFYDYSEAFEDRGRTIQASRSISSLDKRVSPDTEEEVSVKSVNTEHRNSPVELPTGNSHQPNSPAELRGATGSQVKGYRSSAIVNKSLGFDIKETDFAQPKRFTTGTSIPAGKANGVNVDELMKLRYNSGLSVHEPKSKSYASVERRDSPAEDARFSAKFFEPAAIRKSNNVAESSDSSDESMCTAESNSYLENDQNHSRAGTPDASPSMRQHIRASEGDPADAPSPNGANQEISLCESQVDNTEIVSPTPERFITSPLNRHRFSRILGLDDGLSELDDSISRPRQLDHTRFTSSPQPALRIRESLPNNTTVNTSILHLSDADEEPELSPSLMETFGERAESEGAKAPPDSNSKALTNRERSALPFVSVIPEPYHGPNEDSFVGASPPSSTDTSEHVQSRKAVQCLTAAQNRHAQIVAAHSKPILRVDKDLPPVPEEHRSIFPILPPKVDKPSTLPCAFTPIDRRASQDETALEVERRQEDPSEAGISDGELILPPFLAQGKSVDRDSVASSHGSRPWNNDSNYPWTSQPPDLEMALPGVPEGTPPPVGRFPRFMLRIHRASTSTTGSGKLTKRRASSEGTTSSRRSSGHFLNQTVTTFKQKQKPRLPSSPGQVNSSHDIGNESLHTRFVESFDDPPQINTTISSPTITLLAPSPGHEVRSFFSDDSSQVGQKGSLRKRLSEFKARHSQTNLNDEAGGYDRGLLHSALGRSRVSGRSSRQSQHTAGATSNVSQIHRASSVVLRKVKFWWNRSGARLRSWGSSMRSRQTRKAGGQVELYPGA